MPCAVALVRGRCGVQECKKLGERASHICLRRVLKRGTGGYGARVEADGRAGGDERHESGLGQHVCGLLPHGQSAVIAALEELEHRGRKQGLRKWYVSKARYVGVVL